MFSVYLSILNSDLSVKSLTEITKFKHLQHLEVKTVSSQDILISRIGSGAPPGKMLDLGLLKISWAGVISKF